MIPWSELSEREQRNVQTALHDRGIKVSLDEAEAYYGNPEKVEADATKEGDIPDKACPNCFGEITQEGLLLEGDPGFCPHCGEDLSAGGDPSRLVEEVTVPLLPSHVAAIEQGAELTETTVEGFCRDAIRGRLQALENVLAEKGHLRTDGGTPVQEAAEKKPCGERHPLPCALDRDCAVPVSYYDARFKSERIWESYQEAEEACR